MSTVTKAPSSNKTGGSAGGTATKTAEGLGKLTNQAGGQGGAGKALTRAAGKINTAANKTGGAGNQNNPQSAPGQKQKAGNKAAGLANKAADVGEKRALGAVGASVGGTAGKEVGERIAKIKQKIEKKLTGGNEEARLVLRLFPIIAPIAGPILLIIIIIIVIMTIFGGGSKDIKLTLTKTGPNQAVNGQTLDYQINVAYPGSAQDIIVTDPIPIGTDFVSAVPSAIFDPTTRTATWDLKNIVPLQSGLMTNVSTTLAITLKSTADTKWLVNQAQGTVFGEVKDNTNGGGGGAPCGASDTSTNDFNQLMTGQGRCIGILGDENSFVNAVIKNAGAKYRVIGKEPQIHKLYQVAVAKNINPLITLTQWGVESTWSLSGASLGCAVHVGAPQGFDAQVVCGVNNLDHLMMEYTIKAQKGIPVSLDFKSSCKYSDEFIYGYERYTPVCAVNDGNANARSVFVKIYKGFLGK